MQWREASDMEFVMVNMAVAVVALVLMLSALLAWRHSLKTRDGTKLAMTGILLMGLGALATFMIGRF